MAYTLYEFEDAKTCELALAKSVVNRIKTQEYTKLALSGGKSPLGFFRCLRASELKWDQIYISLVDERVVDTNDPQSNTKFIKDEFLQDKASKANFIPLLKEANLEDKALLDFANEHYIKPQLAVLGMGLDGHCASLFADSKGFDEALISEQDIVLIYPKEAEFKRLSMSLAALEKCQRLFLLIAGSQKKEVFDRACLKPDKSLPISLILHSRKVHCEVYYSK